MLREFKQFLLRGNVVDLAVGVVVGAAFGTLVTAFVSGILTPFIGALAKVPDFATLKFSINGSEFLYGEFINALISFLLVSTAVFFFVIKPMNFLIAKTRNDNPSDPTTKKCNECLSDIPIKARRCSHCAEIVI